MKEWIYKLEPHHLVTYQYAVRDRMHSLAKRNWRAEIPFGLLFAFWRYCVFLRFSMDIRESQAGVWI